MNLPENNYPVPQWALTTAIEGLQELALRLEIESVELSKIGTTEARILAKERLEKAWEARKAHEYFLNL